MDTKNTLIRNYAVTDAGVHGSNVFEELLDPDNSSADVWADSAYRSQEKEEILCDLGYRSKVCHKGKRNAPLSETRVEHKEIESALPC